jgi:hypothetical protein
MVGNILLLVLSLATIAAMAVILGWFFRKLSRIQEEHWAEKTGESTPRWARFLVGKPGAKRPAAKAEPANETESE